MNPLDTLILKLEVRLKWLKCRLERKAKEYRALKKNDHPQTILTTHNHYFGACGAADECRHALRMLRAARKEAGK